MAKHVKTGSHVAYNISLILITKLASFYSADALFSKQKDSQCQKFQKGFLLSWCITMFFTFKGTKNIPRKSTKTKMCTSTAQPLLSLQCWLLEDYPQEYWPLLFLLVYWQRFVVTFKRNIFYTQEQSWVINFLPYKTRLQNMRICKLNQFSLQICIFWS